MTKKQSLYYLGAVVTITILVFLYTTLDTSSDMNQVEAEVKPQAVMEPSPEPEPILTSGENDLLNTSWRWLRTENATGTIISEPMSDKPFILSFADSDSMGSQTDCNSIASSYTHGDNTLTFGPLMSTKMFCENSQELEYTSQLQRVSQHAILSNMLLLSLGDNTDIMFFVKVTE